MVFVVVDIDAAHQRLVERASRSLRHSRPEPWGERFFQVTDPNGIVYQLVLVDGRPGVASVTDPM